MLFYLKKSFKYGPVRFNLSKSGIGVSGGGVKGFRVGVNSRGKRYIHAGRHGRYYRKTLQSSNNKPQSTFQTIDKNQQFKAHQQDKLSKIANTLYELKPKSNILKITVFKFFALTGIIGLILPSFSSSLISLSDFMFWSAVVFLPYYTFVYYSVYYSLKLNITTIEKAVEKRDWNLLKQTFEKIIDNRGKSAKSVRYIALMAYYCMLIEIVKDSKINFHEKKVLNFFLEYSYKDEFADVSFYVLETLLSDFTKDTNLDAAEQKLLLDFLAIIPVTKEARAETLCAIAFYKEINKIKTDKLKYKQASLDKIPESQQCYLETDCEILNPKSHSLKSKGRLFITENYLQIMAKEHRLIPFSDILALEMSWRPEEFVELFLVKRKTPLILNCENNLKIFTLMQKCIVAK